MAADRVGLRTKVALAVRIWVHFLVVRAMLQREPLPAFVSRFGSPSHRSRRRLAPRFLSRAVYRSLRVGSRRPTCLISSLVLFRLLREQGDPAEVVIGLPDTPQNKDAHAWVELSGVDVGPPPGRGSHEAMARFG